MSDIRSKLEALYEAVEDDNELRLRILQTMIDERKQKNAGEKAIKPADTKTIGQPDDKTGMIQELGKMLTTCTIEDKKQLQAIINTLTAVFDSRYPLKVVYFKSLTS